MRPQSAVLCPNALTSACGSIHSCGVGCTTFRPRTAQLAVVFAGTEQVAWLVSLQADAYF